MQFNSYIFILAYLPILVIGYFILNKIHTTAGKIYLTAGSALFYLYGGVDNFLILAASILANYILARIIHAADSRKKTILGISILANAALLFYFKYFNFFLSNINGLFRTEFALKDMILPLGISFFTFQQIMYLVNVCRGGLTSVKLFDYLSYILYFPKLLMGPLAEPADLITQFNDPERKHVNWDNISYGLKIFSFGLFKKLILADTFAIAVSWGFSNLKAATSMDFLLVMLSYTFEIYFDFSGYSDMAIGVSTMLNIDLPINFDSPYKAVSIRDFWKRWHISLTGFLTRYIYFPLGGSRKGTLRTYLNTIIVFLVSGLWHGANWTFLLWGALHGLLSVCDRFLEKAGRKLPKVLRWCVTFFFVNLLWLLFRAESISQWKTLLLKIFSFRNMQISDGLFNSFVLPETPLIFKLLHLGALNAAIPGGLSIFIFMAAAFGICLIPKNNYRTLKSNNLITLFLAVIALVWGVLCLSSESVFVYLNF